MPDDNGRVTTREFYNELKELREEQRAMYDRIMERLDAGPPALVERVNNLAKDVSSLESKAKVWDTLNSAAIAVGTFLGIVFGQK